MSKEEEIARFVAFCIEQYKCRHGGDGQSVYELFAEAGALRFLVDHFDVEHCLDPEQIIDDTERIVARSKKDVAKPSFAQAGRSVVVSYGGFAS